MKIKKSEYPNVVKFYKAGATQSQIAKHYGITQVHVHRILKECGALIQKTKTFNFNI
ncbi:helix-turn-helix domain-containing protein [Vibrio parahaemolyticus]|nr:helix-turn-helix domain-containing protein [Vibrio parahaemolyticus]